VRTIYRNQDSPLVLGMVCPDTVNRIPAERLSIDEATRIGFVCWVILDDFSMEHREEDFVKRELIRLCFFIRMIANAEPIDVNGLDYIVNVNVRLLLCTLKHLRLDICMRKSVNLRVFCGLTFPCIQPYSSPTRTRRHEAAVSARAGTTCTSFPRCT